MVNSAYQQLMSAVSLPLYCASQLSNFVIELRTMQHPFNNNEGSCQNVRNSEHEEFLEHSTSVISLKIAQERLRQARYSFNLAMISTIVTVFISLIGAGLLLLGKAPDGAVTAAGGMAASVRCAQLAKEANDRLDRILHIKR